MSSGWIAAAVWVERPAFVGGVIRLGRSAPRLVVSAALIAAAGGVVAGCGEEPTPRVEAPADADEPFVAHQRGDWWMVAPPVDPSMWSLDIPSGGVLSGEASLFEFDQGEPEDLVRRSIAVVTGEVVEIGSPATPSIGAGSEFPSDMSVDEFFGGQVMVPVRIRIDEVLAGAGVEPGAEYELGVGAVFDDGELLEFAEDRIPALGGRYLMFLHASAVDDVPVRSGRLRTTGVGTGRIPLAEACAQSLESRRLEPGQFSFRRNVDVGSLPPGTYRVRLDDSVDSVSDHLLVDREGASIAERVT